MPADFWTEAARMATSGLLVAAAALPVALAARALRPRGEALLPPWQPWRVPWNELGVFAAYLVLLRLTPLVVLLTLEAGGFYAALYGSDFPPLDAKDIDPEALKEANTLRVLWAGLLALPVSVGLLWVAAREFYPEWKPNLAGQGSLAGKIWLGAVAWIAVTPVVLLFHTAVNEVFKQLGVPPDQHALTRLGNRPPLDQALFLLEACVGAPLREELFFRGILLAWCVGRVRAGRSALTDARPWLVMAVAVAFAWIEGKGAAPMVFAGLLAAGLGAVWRLKHTGARRARAVYATAAFFAVVHSGVWPNPIPLFLLGLALGWLAVRTNGILVPVIVHGLFNAVSAVYVLRGG